jgi:hypothetical protein
MFFFFPKKFLLTLLIIFFLLVNTPVVLAGCNTVLAVTVSPTELTKCALETILGEFGINKDSITELNKLAELSKLKKPAPQVTLTFAPTNPIPGEKVTVTATPLNFANPTEALYYTWYLQSIEEQESTDEEAAEKAKLKAMRFYASDGFDWQSTDYNAPVADDKDAYKAILGGNDQKGKPSNCYFYDIVKGDFIQFTTDGRCFHLFPSGAGDNSFDMAEEKKWRTNPDDPDTADTGYPDEANVVGLGAKEFSWIYQAGDKVGVVIEGTSYDPTDKSDSSYKIMWAFLNGKCDDLPSKINGVARVYNGDGSCVANCESNEHYFNHCLLENMLAPTEGGGKNEKIEVSLSFSPSNPVNDTSSEGDNADWINVVSTIENSTKTESLDYTWNVYAGNSADAEAEDWGEPLLKSQLGKDASGNPIVEQTVGAGIPNLKFKANFSDTHKYLKVKLNVSEVVTSGVPGIRKGYAQVVIPLSSFDNKLSAFNTRVDNSLALAADTSASDPKEICKINAGSAGQLVDAAICQIAPDEIIAVKANIIPEAGEDLKDYDLLWTLNNQNLSYKYDPAYTQSDFKPGNLIFFPVLDPEGTTLSLSLVATSKVSGKKISLNKTFLVSKPAFKISSVEVNGEVTSKPKFLGNYIDLDGKEWPDYSQTKFSALKDATVKLSVEQFASIPFPSEEDLPLQWYWNDTRLSETGRAFSFQTTGDIAKSFSLSAKGIYTQDINTKKALNKYWDVPISGFYEKSLSGKVDFSVVDATAFSEVAAAKSDQQKILASFISSVPAYFAFLFRIVMTTFVLVSTFWILFALFPQTEKND